MCVLCAVEGRVREGWRGDGDGADGACREDERLQRRQVWHEEEGAEHVLQPAHPGDVEEGLHARVLARPKVDELLLHPGEADEARARPEDVRQGASRRLSSDNKNCSVPAKDDRGRHSRTCSSANLCLANVRKKLQSSACLLRWRIRKLAHTRIRALVSMGMYGGLGGGAGVTGCGVMQGAPEGILDRCTFVRVGTNKVPMTPAIKTEIMKHVRYYGTGEPVLTETPALLLYVTVAL